MAPADEKGADAIPLERRSGNQNGGVNIYGGTNKFEGHVVGRDQTNYLLGNGLSGEEFEQLFIPLMKAIQDSAPEQKPEATQKAAELKQELQKGDQADDGRMAKILDGLIELVPGAVSAVVGIFATPILGDLAGPVTKFVLEKIQKK